jgi:hypothetical protein
VKYLHHRLIHQNYQLYKHLRVQEDVLHRRRLLKLYLKKLNYFHLHLVRDKGLVLRHLL